MTAETTGSARLFLNLDLQQPTVHSIASGATAIFTACCPDKQTPNEDAAALITCGPESGVLAIADGFGHGEDLEDVLLGKGGEGGAGRSRAGRLLEDLLETPRLFLVAVHLHDEDLFGQQRGIASLFARHDRRFHSAPRSFRSSPPAPPSMGDRPSRKKDLPH